MELKAVIEAFRKCLEISKKHNEFEFELYSDSAYVVNSINNNWITIWQLNHWKTTRGENVKNQDLWSEFVKLKSKVNSKNINIKIIKIKGHAGNPFNELVDKLAKEQSMLA